MTLSRSLWVLPLVAAAMAASPASARRTAIDIVGTIETQGYCDLNGDDCNSPLVLPYFVDFGSGFTNLAFVHGNGILSFGSAVDFNAFSDGSGGFNLPASLAGYSGNVFAAALNNSYDLNFFDPDPIRMGQNVFLQAGRLSLQGNIITGTWYGCNGASDCFVNPYSLSLAPQSNGFLVTYGTTSFVAPATFRFSSAGPNSVPEPSTWLMLIAGFGLAGAAMRGRSRISSRLQMAP